MKPAFEVVRDVLRAGVRAPSAENKHRLRFQLREGGFRLVCTDPDVDRLPHRRWLASISHGAVAENMILRAAELGIGLRVHWLPDKRQADHVADFLWVEPGLPEAIARFIELRHTNRRFFSRGTLPKATLARITTAADAVRGARVVWLDGRVRRLALHAIRIAETERFKRAELHREMFSAIRFDSGWHGRAEAGLPLPSLEVEKPSRAMFSVLRHWRLMRAMTYLGAHHVLGLRSAYLPAAMAPHLGLIVADTGGAADTAPLSAFLVGRVLERAWLSATAQGAAFQPLAAPAALALSAPIGAGWACAPVRAELRKLLGEIGETCCGSPQMFFRLGMAKPPSGFAEREDIGRYIV